MPHSALYHHPAALACRHLGRGSPQNDQDLRRADLRRRRSENHSISADTLHSRHSKVAPGWKGPTPTAYRNFLTQEKGSQHREPLPAFVESVLSYSVAPPAPAASFFWAFSRASLMSALRDRRILLPSMESTLTNTWSPSFSSSRASRMRCSEISLMCSKPSVPGNSSTNAPNSANRTTLPR